MARMPLLVAIVIFPAVPGIALTAGTAMPPAPRRGQAPRDVLCLDRGEASGVPAAPRRLGPACAT